MFMLIISIAMIYASLHMLRAMKAICARMAFKLKGIDSDNGSELINWHFMRYCEAEDLVFARSRPYAKNDGCFVGEKNWPVARRVVGYGRYEGQAACDVLNKIYEHQRILANYFMPSAKLIARTRDGSRVVRFRDDPMTPYRRLTAMKGVGKATRDRMRAEFKAADPLKAAHGDTGAHAGAPEDEGIAVMRKDQLSDVKG